MEAIEATMQACHSCRLAGCLRSSRVGKQQHPAQVGEQETCVGSDAGSIDVGRCVCMYAG